MVELENTTAGLHEPLYATFVVTNDLDEEVRGPVRNDNFEFLITRPDGAVDRASGRRYGVSFTGGIQPDGNHDIVVRLAPFKPRETFRVKVLLNEFYSFPLPGRYRIEMRTPADFTTVSGRPIRPTEPGAIRIEVRERNDNRLRAICADLARQITSGPSETANEAALALRFIEDPIAVPFLREVLQSTTAVAYKEKMVEALAWIGSSEAVDALIESLTARNDPDVINQVVSVLKKTQATTSDVRIRERIAAALSRR